MHTIRWFFCRNGFNCSKKSAWMSQLTRYASNVPSFLRKKYANFFLRKNASNFDFFLLWKSFLLILFFLLLLHSSASLVEGKFPLTLMLVFNVLMERFEAVTEAVEVLRPMVTTTGPFLTSLKRPMASWWVMPWTGTLLIEKISSPARLEKGWC